MRFWPCSSFRILTLLVCLALSPPVLTRAQSGVRLKGVILDKSGTVITGTSVYLYSKRKTAQTTSDETGSFEFTDLPAGTYRLEAKHDGFETLIVQPLHIKTGDAEGLRLTVTLDVAVMGGCGELSSVSYKEREIGAVPLMGFIQPRPPAPEPEEIWLPKVTWPYIPFSQATIELLKFNSSKVVATTHPDARGNFEFNGITNGEYILRAKYQGYYDNVSVKFQVTSEDVSEVTMHMQPLGEITVCM